jgi:hypothetical protein
MNTNIIDRLEKLQGLCGNSALNIRLSRAREPYGPNRSIQTVVSGIYDKLDQIRTPFGPDRTIEDILDDLIVRRTVLNHLIKLLSKPLRPSKRSKRFRPSSGDGMSISGNRQWRSAKRLPKSVSSNISRTKTTKTGRGPRLHAAAKPLPLPHVSSWGPFAGPLLCAEPSLKNETSDRLGSGRLAQPPQSLRQRVKAGCLDVDDDFTHVGAKWRIQVHVSLACTHDVLLAKSM